MPSSSLTALGRLVTCLSTLLVLLPAAQARHDPATAHPLGTAPSQVGGPSRIMPADNIPLLPTQAFNLAAWVQDAHHLSLMWTMPKGYYLYRNRIRLSLKNAPGLHLKTPVWPSGTPHRDPLQGKTIVYFNQLELPIQIAGSLAGRQHFMVQVRFQGCQEEGLCYPLMKRAVMVDLTRHPPAATVTGLTGPTVSSSPPASSSDAVAPAHAATATGQAWPDGLWVILMLAFIGGLLLNLMPCVLPVLSIKVIGLLESGGSPLHRRRHALAYTAGVLCSFTGAGMVIVVLRASGQVLGWGAHMQQPLMVAGLTCVIFVLGLSMSGVVQWGGSLGQTGDSLARLRGMAGDFFTGVLAVVVASPCTAPFMGAALAWALAAPRLMALLVFMAMGLGLALPFLLTGFVPAVARWLPRPGRWMETLRQILAFPMYLTAVWLVWVLGHQRGVHAMGLLLVTLVLLALALWWFERSRGYHRRRALALLPVLLAVTSLYGLTYLPIPERVAQNDIETLAYNPQRLAQLRSSGTPVLVNMTADWCITCKVNAYTVLDTEAFHALLKRTGTVYIKGDWTSKNPQITAFLQRYHSPGIPLYVLFPKGGGKGRRLPTMLTFNIMKKALNQTPLKRVLPAT